MNSRLEIGVFKGRMEYTELRGVKWLGRNSSEEFTDSEGKGLQDEGR